MGSSGTHPAGAKKQRGEKGTHTAFQQTRPQLNQPPQYKQQLDEACTTEQSLPTPRSASSQCNECFRQQHTFPFPQRNRWLPTSHLGSEQAAHHQPKNHSQPPKGQELPQISVPRRMVVGRAAPPTTNVKKKKKKKYQRRGE